LLQPVGNPAFASIEFSDSTGTSAAAAGVQVGDEVIDVDGVPATQTKN
jgi:hypothetical protein